MVSGRYLRLCFVVLCFSLRPLKFCCFWSGLAVASLGVLGLVSLHEVDITIATASSFGVPQFLVLFSPPLSTSSMPVGLGNPQCWILS